MLDRENARIDEDELRLHFRVGICTGSIAICEKRLRDGRVFGFEVGGVNIGKAVRLQSAAKTGEILACAQTIICSNGARQEGFPAQDEQVYGKKHEKRPIKAYRRRVLRPHHEEQTELRQNTIESSG